ncbi:GNAT family N-acetyltransferase [Kribbella sp. DT2]|uniref:GNAT family N-acetyltransferase n=1 Tax=Kribbella sp. DT2 TaxID=3393427 RepID=UPI003CECF409
MSTTPTAPAILTAPATATGAALTLRPWRLDDLAALIEAHQDPALHRWTRSGPRQESDGEEWFKTQQENWASGKRLAFAVLEAGKLLGSVVLKEVAPGKPTAEVGYWTAAAARGRGVAPRALESLTQWAFRSVGIEAIDLIHQVDNPGSCRVAEKTGYPLDSTLPALPPEYPLAGHLHRRRAA